MSAWRKPAGLAAVVMILLLKGVVPAASLKDITVGQEPPTFSLKDLTGQVYSLDYFSRGAGVILFWSTWSPRSAEILKDFRRYHREYGPKGLKIVAVNIDGEKLKVPRQRNIRQYAWNMNLAFPVLMDEKLEAFVSYGVIAHPSAVVLGADGRIAYTLGGYPPELRDELRDSFLKALGLYVEPERVKPPAAGYIPRGGALPYYNAGLHLMEKGQVDRALDNFRKASRRDPGFIEPVIMIARLHLAEGESGEAEALVRKLDPEMINRNDIRYLLGNLIFQKGDVEEARKIFTAMTDRAPGEGWGWWGLGMVSLDGLDIEGALSLMRTARRLQPANPEAEAYVRDYLEEIWITGGEAPREALFLEIFPSLINVRTRYRKLFELGGKAG